MLSKTNCHSAIWFNPAAVVKWLGTLTQTEENATVIASTAAPVQVNINIQAGQLPPDAHAECNQQPAPKPNEAYGGQAMNSMSDGGLVPATARRR